MGLRSLIASQLALLMGGLRATAPVELSAVEVRAKSENLRGLRQPAAKGRVQSAPGSGAGAASWRGDEMVLGLIVTQHAGDGKANQYFCVVSISIMGPILRPYIGGVPVNMPTHAHGQGYTDLNFSFLSWSSASVSQAVFRRGGRFFVGRRGADRLFPAVGQVAGATDAGTERLCPQPACRFAAGWPASCSRDELFHNDGPWQVDEHYRKLNGVFVTARAHATMAGQ